MSKRLEGTYAPFYSYEVRNKHGRIVRKRRPTLSRSFLIGYARYLYLKMLSATEQSITDTGTTVRTIVSISGINCEEVAGTTTDGLVVGTGTNAVALADTALQTQIAHGTGAGQLQYGASTVALPSSDATGTSLQLTRVFTNGSTGSITIREIGIYAAMDDTAGSGRKICIVRDTVTITLAVGDQLTLNYILRTTV